MADGNSTGPGITPPVQPVATVIRAGDFAPALTDDQINLHLMNNHIIKALVLAHADDVAPPMRIIDNISENVRSSADHFQSLDPETARIVAGQENIGAANREDIANVRRINNARDEIAQAEAAMEEGIFAELQRVSDVFSQTADILNAQNADGERIRSEIARIDGEIASIVAQLDSLASQMEVFHVDMVPSDAGRQGLGQTMDASGIEPPPRAAVGDGPLYDSWSAALMDLRFHRPYMALMAASGRLRQRYRALQANYPTEYKRYQRILGGFSDLDEPIDWGNIVSTVVWFIATEAAFHAAAIALAPITGGVGTAVLYAARMAERAGRLGRMAASGIRSGQAVARWLLEIDRRLWAPFDRAFSNAVNRLRGRGTIRRGDPGGEVKGKGEPASTRPCRAGACAGA